MDFEKKEHLKMLKEKNRLSQERVKINKNPLLQECLEVLSSNMIILRDDERKDVYEIFIQKIPFAPWGIDWEKFDVTKSIDNIEQVNGIYAGKEFYIIWNRDFPIIKCDICTIIIHYDDICAVEPDTWLFSTDYKEAIEIHHEGKITVGMVN